MVLSEVVNTHYAFPVGIVLICAILVFVFGFKSAEQPAFDQLSTYTGDDRKPAGKKRKLKDKKSQSNGHATAVGDRQAAEVKSNPAKATKSEKSPLKEVSNKAKKPESSPIKEKSLVKQKDNKKDSESASKQLKEKKQATEKSPVKNNKNVAANSKGKGKENQVEEIKNKKNEKNLAKVQKSEGKPSGDGGGWMQVLSNKDKKNRKKDEPEFDYIVPEKIGKVEGSPKKKKTKNIELVIADISTNKENKDVEEGKEIEAVPKKAEKVKKSNKVVENNTNELEKNGDDIEKKVEKKEKIEKVEKIEKMEKMEKTEKKNADKQAEKKKKVEQESKGEKDVDEKIKVEEKTKVVEEILVAKTSSSVELSPDAAALAKKKSKKKADNKKEAAIEIAEEVVAPKKLSESSDNVDSNKKSKPVEITSTESESKADPATTVVFDELGDTWKEAKVPKKNKKKVRKDQ